MNSDERSVIFSAVLQTLRMSGKFFRMTRRKEEKEEEEEAME